MAIAANKIYFLLIAMASSLNESSFQPTLTIAQKKIMIVGAPTQAGSA
jgi:hypothetical protein